MKIKAIWLSPFFFDRKEEQFHNNRRKGQNRLTMIGGIFESASPGGATQQTKGVSTMKQGTLVFDMESGRYDIRFDLSSYYGGLHCGECFDVMVGGKWKPTRIEMAADWYLVGIRTDNLQGLRVRM